MTLVDTLAAAAGLEPAQAGRALGSLVAALKLSAPPALMAPIEAAVPELGPLAAQSLPALGGRTGELVSIVAELASERGARQLERQLAGAGVEGDRRRALVAGLLAELRERAGAPALDALLAAVPALSHLAT